MSYYDPTKLGDFARFPLEMRQLIWEALGSDTGLMSLANSSIQNDIRTTLDLKFTVRGGKPYAESGSRKHSDRGVWWPTEIGVCDQHRQLPPLHPAFFDFRSPDQARLQQFLDTPLHLYRSVELNVQASRGREQFLRSYNSLLWFLDLLARLPVQQLPPIELNFMGDEEYTSWLCWAPRKFGLIDAINAQPIYDRSRPKDWQYFVEPTTFYIMLRALRKLRNAKRLSYYYPANLEDLPEWPQLWAEMQELGALAVSEIPFGAGPRDQEIQAEIDMRTAYYEMALPRLRSCGLLCLERHAFWNETYERGARARIENARLADGSSPAFVGAARRTLEQQS